mgnify:FL=1
MARPLDARLGLGPLRRSASLRPGAVDASCGLDVRSAGLATCLHPPSRHAGYASRHPTKIRNYARGMVAQQTATIHDPSIRPGSGGAGGPRGPAGTGPSSLYLIALTARSGRVRGLQGSSVKAHARFEPRRARGRGRALEYEGRPISGVGFNNYRGFRLQAARLVSRVSVHRLATLRLTRTTTG